MSERTRVDRLIEEVLACAPEDRDAFLDAACEGNGALRQEIASLLEQASRAHSFLEQPAAVPSLIGQMLGPYRIDAPIGAGGMGEVYRARDTKLGRDVAIKILPAFLLRDPDLLARLGREARTLAAFNHPNIGSIYGLEEADGVRGLVLELIDGDTLADRIARGPLPIVETVRIASQIAGALAATHAKGIVHRDLKPANIKVTTTGIVKVLDFGLAKTDTGETESTTLATRLGTVMGTPAYMSPEQARGESVDQQTDIWAFGCVLYEMLTARRAFGGGTASDCIAAILKAEPDWLPLPAATPAAVRTLLARCLAKDRSQRLHSIADAQFDLAGALDGPASARRTNRLPAWQKWSLAAALGLALGVAGYLYSQSAEAPVTSNVELVLPDGFNPWAGLAISPDGKAIVASVARNVSGAGMHVIVNYLGQQNGWQRLKGSENGEYPFWSPDGKHIAFFVKDQLLRVDPPNGVPVVVCDVVGGRGGVWLDDGTIVFAELEGSLMRVNAEARSAPAVFVPIEEGMQSLRYPAMAGAGRLLYLAQHADDTRSELRSIELDAPDRPTRVMMTPKSGIYERGFLFYDRNGTMVRQRFDPSTSALIGEPVPIIAEGIPSGRRGYLPIAVGAQHLAVAMVPRPLMQLVSVDRDGRPVGEIGEAVDQEQLELSPDGKRLAVVRRLPGQAARNIWIVERQSGVSRPLTTGQADFTPVWSPDSQRLAYSWIGGSIHRLYSLNVEGAQSQTLITERNSAMSPAGWALDGRFVWGAQGSTTDTDLGKAGIFMEGRAGSGHPEPFRVGLYVSGARLSPDGRHIAFVSGKSGRSEVYVDTFPTRGAEPTQLTTKGGGAPRWARNGRELYFVTGDDLMVVAVSPGASQPLGVPARVFRLPASRRYTVNSDGSTFIVLEPGTSPASSLKLTLNWFFSVSAKN